ncbi:hypothetical protein [Actinomadura rudentiformis]|uniref:Uncharacterized protein n=1 Tax=Actinomadura rudentiformis TaxID=359158 RepID=A0A6H9Z1A2_9ACTN|nr:hypothetical protein [Actinomadura rudentiformis]KAB2350325.1 hypothetical protein F8566_11155 [Actinomadura rudentiformis]
MNHDIDTLTNRINPVTDARAAELLTDETAADLARRITTATAEADELPATPARTRGRRRLTIGLPLLATGVAGAVVAVSLVTQSEDSGGPVRLTPTQATQGQIKLASALSFTRKDRYLDVRVRDPYADPKRYRAEFAQHGLNVSLSLVPVSPSMVGTVVMQDTSEGTRPGDITDLRVKGACEVPSGGNDCTVGVRIRTGYKGSAAIVFGRAARRGEKYESTAQPDARGEAMHGMVYRKRHVSQVLAALKKRDITVPEYRVMVGNESQVRYPGQVPGNWYVHSAVPWADGQVMLFVGPKPTEAQRPNSSPPGVPVQPSSPPQVTPSATPTT